MILGGYGHDLAPRIGCTVTFTDDEVHVSPSSSDGLSLSYNQITNVDLGGGATRSGGGFVGGGFGLEGFALGAAAAGILNSLTTRNKIETVIGFQWNGGELILLCRDATPETLRIRLSRLFGIVRDRAASFEVSPLPQASPAGSVADEIEKFAALRDRGILSSEEFEKKKRELLDS